MQIFFLPIHTYHFLYNHLCNLLMLEGNSTSPEENTLESAAAILPNLCLSSPHDLGVTNNFYDIGGYSVSFAL